MYLISDMVKTIIPFDLEQAVCATKLHSLVSNKGISLGDRACIALGIKLRIPVYTADKIWKTLELEGADIRLIR